MQLDFTGNDFLASAVARELDAIYVCIGNLGGDGVEVWRTDDISALGDPARARVTTAASMPAARAAAEADFARAMHGRLIASTVRENEQQLAAVLDAAPALPAGFVDNDFDGLG